MDRLREALIQEVPVFLVNWRLREDLLLNRVVGFRCLFHPRRFPLVAVDRASCGLSLVVHEEGNPQRRARVPVTSMCLLSDDVDVILDFLFMISQKVTILESNEPGTHCGHNRA